MSQTSAFAQGLIVTDNLYEPPIESGMPPVVSRNVVGCVSFSLSLVGVIGLVLVGQFGPAMNTVGMSVAFLCLSGLIAGIVGLFRTPRRLAAWGVALGVLGSLYLPTFYFAMFVASR